MRRLIYFSALALASLLMRAPSARAGEAEAVLAQAAAQQQFTFLLFYRADDPPTQAMASTLKNGLARRPGVAALSFVQLANPAEAAAIDRFKVGRAPMPLTLAVAPNGAVTGIFSKQLLDKHIEDSLVTPGKAACMKALQDGKLVFACVDSSPDAPLPPAVQEFEADPQFKGRTVAVAIAASDPAEARFLPQLGVDPKRGPMTVFMAPPSVVVGKYGPGATKAQMAAALHAAGKCCDDPNCKHAAPGAAAAQPGTPPRQTAQPAPRRK